MYHICRMAEKEYCSVQTDSGVFRGVRTGGIRVFRGILYARSERFRDSVPFRAGTEIYDATRHRTVPPQRSKRLVSVIGPEKGSRTEEGPLYLTVYAPEEGHGLAVMVWIHGGSYMVGGSEERRYSGRRLVTGGNLIVVKISYRLGALGYMVQEDGSCNFGMHDQMLALKWVKENIAAFGGDSGNITVFGQSAGAHSIAAMVSSYEERPPFRRAILQSPPLGIVMDRKTAEAYAAGFRKRLGKDPEKATCEEILDVQMSMKDMNKGVPFMPVLENGLTISRTVVENGIEFLAGYNAQDASPMISKALGVLYRSPAGGMLTRKWTRKIFSEPCADYVRRLKDLGLRAGLYRMEWYPEGSPLKCCHSLELPFLLGEYEDWKDSRMLNGLCREEFERISGIMLGTWTSFARDGSFTGLGGLGSGF